MKPSTAISLGILVAKAAAETTYHLSTGGDLREIVPETFYASVHESIIPNALFEPGYVKAGYDFATFLLPGYVALKNGIKNLYENSGSDKLMTEPPRFE